MRYKLFAASICLTVCALAKADTILPANCATTAALCANTPSVSGSITTIATDYRGYVDDSYGSSTVTSTSYTLYDSTYKTTVSSGVSVGFGGVHGSAVATAGGSGGAIARFTGTITDYFEVAGTVPKGAQLKVTYGADMLSNTSSATSSDYMANLSLNVPGDTAQCFNVNQYHQGNLTGTCAEYVPISTGNSSRIILTFYTELDGSNKGSVYLDASDTAKFDTITVVDAQGNPLSGLQLYDASGFNYNAVAPTPEPSAMILLGTGIAAVTGPVRKRRRVAQSGASHQGVPRS